MKWYGKSFYKEKNVIKNIKNATLHKTKQSSIDLINKINLNNTKFFFHLSNKWDFLLIKKNNNNTVCYIYSLNYFFFFPILTTFTFFNYDKQTHCLLFYFFHKNNFFNIFSIFFKNIFFSFSKIFFKKLKFKGKGYYIYKNKRNTIALQFGYSHRFYLYSFSVLVKFITKTIILIFGINKSITPLKRMVWLQSRILCVLYQFWNDRLTCGLNKSININSKATSGYLIKSTGELIKISALNELFPTIA